MGDRSTRANYWSQRHEIAAAAGKPMFVSPEQLDEMREVLEPLSPPVPKEPTMTTDQQTTTQEAPFPEALAEVVKKELRAAERATELFRDLGRAFQAMGDAADRVTTMLAKRSS